MLLAAISARSRADTEARDAESATTAATMTGAIGVPEP
jgi:hypothetical protein